MTIPYDRALIAGNFDGYGDAEWDRHEASPFARVSFRVHRHYLERFVRPGDRGRPGRTPSELRDRRTRLARQRGVQRSYGNRHGGRDAGEGW